MTLNSRVPELFETCSLLEDWISGCVETAKKYYVDINK